MRGCKEVTRADKEGEGYGYGPHVNSTATTSNDCMDTLLFGTMGFPTKATFPWFIPTALLHPPLDVVKTLLPINAPRNARFSATFVVIAVVKIPVMTFFGLWFQHLMPLPRKLCHLQRDLLVEVIGPGMRRFVLEIRPLLRPKF
ncbi:hypothetical protein M407DRAFT_159080 [Tulasnella calospora MUT 4182]|uniref:Uncharacterized protein n=1 Tax=Tulasnella calospora MUT 4182 TaxID=1051891 RepID=A0A0C3LAG1_9AGAM|nr:hypothetical protein M407DRAFT_159080 [Tulasnella calospora MUT 4182]